MNSETTLYHLANIEKLGGKLRMILLLQGGLWIIISCSLYLLPASKFTNTILMSIIGISFIGTGFSIEHLRRSYKARIKQLELLFETQDDPAEFLYHKIN